ncbi:hypothetical protein GKZ89_06020 [Bacillus mangrovi]|uniref:Uncharacterized protein n=1 Tax=Metabacillus mangrovi TaxID=1491830 RepID=A0A7X2S494_9BACI|nr:hypothetical protein [Metabacillus mangrovi]MTH52961.1 hypothetical protein [Metabacillus mangrovi]
MFNNERGQSLLTVMVISLIFTVLGAAIITSALGGSKRTEIRIGDIELTAEVERKLNEAIAEFTKTVTDPIAFKLTNAVSPADISLINSKLINARETLIAKAKTGTGEPLQIRDLSTSAADGFKIDTTNYLSRVYEFSYTLQDGSRKKTVKKKVFLSPTPSFFNYAAGTGPEGEMLLNGASEFKGNIYTKKLITENKAQYYDASSNGKAKSASTLYPRVNGKALIRSDVNGIANFSDRPALLSRFDQKSAVTFQKENDLYIPVNFENTLLQVIKEVGGTAASKITENDITNSAKLDQVIKQIVTSGSTKCEGQLLNLLNPVIGIPILTDKCPQTIKTINSFAKPADIFSVTNSLSKHVVASNFSSIQNNLVFLPHKLTIQTDFSLADKKWMIVHGDLEILANSNQPIKLQGNIFVTGNLTIKGNETNASGGAETVEDDTIQVDSTIYALGGTTISNTNLSGFDDSQLVVMTKKDLNVSRINEFTEYSKAERNPLDAFLYTDAKAELFGVGSIYKINGGIFAEDQLTIHAIRQNSVRQSNKVLQIETPSFQGQDNQHSRFSVTHDPTVLIDQLDALPRVDQYQIIMGETIITR